MNTLSLAAGTQYAYTDIVISDNSDAANCVGSALTLSAGQNASGVFISGGELNVGSGAQVEETLISRGVMYVEKGALASETMVFDWSTQYVLGSAANTVVSGQVGSAVQHIVSGGTANYTTVKSAGRQFVVNGAAASNTTVESGGYQFVFSGGRVQATAVAAGGSQVLSAGATASTGVISGASAAQTIIGGSAYGFDVYSGGSQILSAGLASGTKIYNGGKITVLNGSAVSATLSSGGTMLVSGGAVTALKHEVGGRISVNLATGGTIQGTNASGAFSFDGTSASGFIMYNSAILTVGLNKYAYNTIVSSGGTLYINAGTGSGCVISSGGVENVVSGMTKSTKIMSGGRQQLDGGSAYRCQIYAGGSQCVAATGITYDTVVNAGGEQWVGDPNYSSDGVIPIYLDCGSAFRTVLMSGGKLYVASGQECLVDSLVQSSGGILNIWAGDEKTVIRGTNDNGSFLVSGGVASNAIIYSGGVLNFWDQGTARNTEVYAGGKIAASGVLVYLNGLTVHSGGVATVSNARISGVISLGATMNNFCAVVESSTTINFLVNERTTTDDAILSSGASIARSADYSITVSGIQKSGSYKLAAGSSIYEGTMTVYNTSGNKLGTLQVDGSLTYSTTTYSLLITDNTLILKVVGPDSNVEGDFTCTATPDTKYNATLSWSFTGSAANYEVKLDDGTVKTTSASSLKLTKLSIGSHSFTVRAITSSGLYSEWSTECYYTVNDYTAPTSVSGKATVSGYSVTFTLSGSDNVGVKKYTVTCAGKSVTTETATATLADFGVGKFTAEVIAYDAAGNASKAGKISFTVKDATAPDKVIGLATPTVDGQYNATLNWTAGTDNSGSVAKYEISVDGKIYSATKNTVKVSKLSVGEHTYLVRAIDKEKNVGEWSDAVAFTVADTTAPTSVSGKATVSGYSVTFTLSGKDNVGVTKYTVTCAGKSVTTETATATLADFGVGKFTAEVIAYDAAGNAGKVGKISFTVKDATAPDKVIGLATPTVDGQYNATLNWTAGTDNSGSVAKYEISVDGKIYSATKNTVKVSKLSVGEHTYLVRAIDKEKNVGEWSDAVAFTVADTTAPTSVSGKATVSGYSVTFTLSGSDNVGVKKYTVTCAGKSVTTETANATLADFGVGNFTAEVIAYDAAGNAGKVGKISFTVKDATAPDKVIGLATPTVDGQYNATLNWTAGTDNSGSVAKYEISVDGKIYSATSNSLKVSKLSVGGHTYMVRAIDKEKNVGEWSDAVAFTVADTTAPGKVSVKAKVSDNTISLTWTKPTDNVGVTGFTLRYGLNLENTVTLESGTLSFDIDAPTKGTWSYELTAFDAAGNTGTAATGKSVIKTDLAATGIASSLTDLSWDAAIAAATSEFTQSDEAAYKNGLLA